MKTFYTERDIEDLHAGGKTEVEISDDVILTHVAVERARSLGVKLVKAKMPTAASPERSKTPIPKRTSLSKPPKSGSKGEAVSAQAGLKTEHTINDIKTQVIKRLGTQEYNDLLDRIIPLVLSSFKDKKFPS